MGDFALDAMKLFFAGKLFKDNRKVMLRFALAAVGGALVGIVLGQFAPLWVAAVAAGAVAGFAQPILLKSVKYA